MDKKKIEELLKVDLFEELGIKNLSADEQLVFLEKIGDVIQKRLMIRFLKELTEEQKDRLESIIADKGQDFDSVARFLTAEISDYQKIVEEELASYKKELIDRYKS